MNDSAQFIVEMKLSKRNKMFIIENFISEQMFCIVITSRNTYSSRKDKWKEQRRDTVKEYMNCVNLTIATLGIENQSTMDENEPIRVIGYDYGSYRQQIVDS